MEKNFREYDGVYLILLDYMKQKYAESAKESKNLVAIRLVIDELDLALVYDPIIELSFARTLKGRWDDRPVMQWYELKKMLLIAKTALLTSPNSTTRELAKLVYEGWKDADPRWQAMASFLRVRMNKYDKSGGYVDAIIEGIPELDIEIEFRSRPNGVVFRKLGQRDLYYTWSEIRAKLDAENVRIKLLTSPSELSRVVGQAYE